jgi:glycosyltransferase involved in cell wall biosynthesis
MSKSPSPDRTEPERLHRVSVFVPAYNEAANLEGALRDIVGAAAVLADYEVIIVNDGSRDGTGQLAERLAQENRRIRVVHQPRNLGIAAAYERALDEAKLEYFSFLPGDGEIAPQSIRDILAAVGTADIVAPYHGNSQARQLHRRVLTWTSTTLVNTLFGLRMRYFQGPCIYQTPLARRLPKTAGGFYFLTEMLVHAVRAGYSYVEVPLTHQDRSHGRSKAVSVRNVLKALRAIAILWWAIHIRKESIDRRA